MANELTKLEEYEIEAAPDSSTLAAIQGAEIDRQIATAHAFPRSIKAFRNQAMELATLDEKTALECMYSLPRSGKKITGPSVRLAEIIASSWGNCRFGARIVEEQKDFVVAQGVFHDLEKNSFVSFEVKRRITDKYGKRFNVDMIGVTGNAACSIALRNAVFKGVPKALWQSVYDAALNTAFGKNMSLAERRTNAITYFEKAGATREEIFATLAVADETEITLDDMVWLTGIRNGLQENEYTIDTVFKNKTTEPKREYDLVKGKFKDADEDPLEGDKVPTEPDRTEAQAAKTAEKEKPKAKSKPKAKAKAAEPKDEPEAEPQQELDVDEAEAPADEDEDEPMPEAPTLVLADAVADPVAWVDAFVEYYAALPRTEEDGFLDEISEIQRWMKANAFDTCYKRISAAVAEKA